VQRTIAIAEDERRLGPELKGLVNDPNPRGGARVLLAIGRIQDSTSVPTVLPLLNDASVEVRREAVFALGQIGHVGAAPRSSRKLDESDAETARLAIESARQLGDKARDAPGGRATEATGPARRGEAAIAMWRLADSSAVDALLLRAHEDPDPEVRWRCLYALEKIPSPRRSCCVAAPTSRSRRGWCAHTPCARSAGRRRRAAIAYLLQQLADRRGSRWW
jgi:HEAT repeat protein